MNYDTMGVAELALHGEKLRGEIELLKIGRRQCARALEAHVTNEQAKRDLARLGPERVKAMAQVLSAQGVASTEAVGGPAAQG